MAVWFLLHVVLLTFGMSSVCCQRRNNVYKEGYFKYFPSFEGPYLRKVDQIEDNSILSHMNSPERIVCFFVIESDNPDALAPDNIDSNLCTHIIVGFAAIRNSTLVPSNPLDVKVYELTMKMKLSNPTLKIILSVGGEFSNMVATQEKRQSFIHQSLGFLHQYGFDGIDFDWEFPAWSNLNLQEKHLFTVLLQEYRQGIDQDSEASASSPLLLSADVAAPFTIVAISYEVSEIARYVDFVNIMCYDLHFYMWYTPFTGHNSPLFSKSLLGLDVESASNHWVQLGMPKSLINVGIPTYGHTFKLWSSQHHDVGAFVTENGLNDGWISYPQVCDFIAAGGISVFDTNGRVPYSYHDLDWISHENIQSIAEKAAWVRDQTFGGIMVFDLNSDDWKGSCPGNETFPLHKALRNTTNS